MKKKLLIFHPALAPYRVDSFNKLSEIFDLHIVFLFTSVWYDNFDQKKLLESATYNYSYLLNGPDYKGRTFRFGMLKKIRNEKPDFIIGYEYSFTTIFLVILKSIGLITKPIGITTDDSIDMCSEISGFRLASRKFCLPRLDFLVVLSEKIKNYLNESKLFSGQNIIVSPILQDGLKIRSGNKKQLEIAENYANDYKLHYKINLLFVGRLVEEKGLEKFIEIFSNISINDQYNLIIVGDGNLRETLIKKVRELKLENNVLFPGRFEGDELFAWYRLASGFVLPSSFEPFGAVVNEAQIFGLRVFCSDKAGASVLIENKSKGIVFNIEKDYTELLKDFIDSLEILSDIKSKNDLSSKNNYIDSWTKVLYN